MEERLLKQLKREASLHGMCKENRLALDSTETKAEAIALYKKTIDWALEEGFPSLMTLRRFFKDSEPEGVYIDKTFHGDVLKEQQVYVFHNCHGTIKTGLNVEKRIIPMLYFANDCDMTIVYSGPSGLGVYVPLYIFGDNSIRTQDTADATFRTYKFDAK